MNEDIYGVIAQDASTIYRRSESARIRPHHGHEERHIKQKSPWLTEFFQGMVGTLTSGGQLKLYFLNRAEHYMRENRTRLGQFLETLR